MPVSSQVYGPALRQFATGGINFTGDTIKAALLTSAYTPDLDAHEFFSHVSAAQASGAGYTAGGVTLASKTATYDAATNTLTLDAADPSWANSTLTARYLVFYKDSGTAGTSPLLALVDFGENVSSTTGAFTYTLPATGLVQFTAA